MTDRAREHWERVYATRQSHELGWTEEVPRTSLEFIHSLGIPKTARIIDIGGGESRLVDFLLSEGFENVTVLDISEHALARAKERLGERAERVSWIVADVLDFEPELPFDLWHDRAAFHFLTTGEQVRRYIGTAERAVSGHLIMGTFSEKGPVKCSGLDVHHYSEEELQETLRHGFEKIRCITEDHVTPFQTRQNFLFCSFRKRPGVP